MGEPKPQRSRRAPSDQGFDEFGRSPLHYAAADGALEKVSSLLAAGADPNVQDDQGWSPLHFAAQATSAESAEALIAAGANTELQDTFGNTPLWRAVFASRGDGSVIRLLRGAGANPHVENKSGLSPLMLARRINNHRVAQFFDDLNPPPNTLPKPT